MHRDAMDFVRRFATDDPLTIVEIGSRNINGSVRRLFPNAIYTGLDLYEGPDVDVICNAAEYQPVCTPDLVICCEVLEHAENWRELIQAASRWLGTGGRYIMTCANPLRRPHSAIDGGKLRDGEYYRGLTAGEIAGELWQCDMLIDSAESIKGDCRVSATRPY